MKKSKSAEKTKVRKGGKRATDTSEVPLVAKRKHTKTDLAAKPVKDRVKGRLYEVAQTASDGVVKCADDYVQVACAKVRELEDTTYDAARRFEQSQPEVIVQSVDYLSEQIGHVADYFESKPAAEVLDDTRKWIQSHPMMSIGALSLIGLASGVYFKSGGMKTSTIE